MKIKYVLLLVVFFYFFSCINKKQYLILTEEKSKPNTNLRTDGYYYNEKYSPYAESFGYHDVEGVVNRLQPLLLYKDGTFKYCMGHHINYSTKNIDQRHKPFTDRIRTIVQGNFNGLLSGWGHFNIKGDSIICRYFWYAADNIGYVLFEQKGIVVNDSTFILDKLRCYDEGWARKIGPDIYKFRKYNVKPDSTNPTFDF